MSVSAQKNGTFMKVFVAALTLFSVLSAGWAACATMNARDIDRIERDGTKLARQLDTRVTLLEATVRDTLPDIKAALKDISRKLDSHMENHKP